MDIFAFRAKVNEFHNANCGYHLNGFWIYLSYLDQFAKEERQFGSHEQRSLLKSIQAWYYGVLLEDSGDAWWLSNGVIKHQTNHSLPLGLSVEGNFHVVNISYFWWTHREVCLANRVPKFSVTKLSPRALKENSEKVVSRSSVSYTHLQLLVSDPSPYFL